jgi:hypothetical protein
MRLLLLPALLAFPLARADELVQNGGFERPEVQQRTPAKDGGDPAVSGWARARGFPAGESGEVEVGLTTGDAHAGRQALYVTFRSLTKNFASGYVSTSSIRVAPGQAYSLGIWGKLDPKDPLTTESGQILVRANVSFLRADGTKLPEKFFHKTAASGGSKRFFDETDWRLFAATVEPPPEAATMTVSWVCQLDGKDPKASGTILLDDASIEGPPAP